jgi:predicted metal-dependent phosphoesterase TrpH
MRVYFQKPDVEKLRHERMLVDMHFHSRYSYDSSTSVESIIKRAKELGVSVVLTDHNAIGGVLAAERIAPGIIKPGVEICTAEGKEVIPYFYSVKELEEFFNKVLKPKLKVKTSLQSNSTGIYMDELIDELRRCNCLIGLPHPFALPPRRSYKFFSNPTNRPMLKHVHAFEVINQTMLHRQNLASIGWAMQFDKAITGGTDGHTITPLGNAFTVGQADSWEGFLDEVRAKRVAVIGEERLLRHQMANATHIIREKAKFLQNFKKRKE